MIRSDRYRERALASGNSASSLIVGHTETIPNPHRRGKLTRCNEPIRCGTEYSRIVYSVRIRLRTMNATAGTHGARPSSYLFLLKGYPWCLEASSFSGRFRPNPTSAILPDDREFLLLVAFEAAAFSGESTEKELLGHVCANPFRGADRKISEHHPGASIGSRIVEIREGRGRQVAAEA
ncbi:MAG: hypothetical protein JWQ87_2111 [Candidatus Sulfotelmatobacter sp.]|nr:hypothetical protein [Candidatus Sulfotelmatobacter sp.]